MDYGQKLKIFVYQVGNRRFDCTQTLQNSLNPENTAVQILAPVVVSNWSVYSRSWTNSLQMVFIPLQFKYKVQAIYLEKIKISENLPQ